VMMIKRTLLFILVGLLLSLSTAFSQPQEIIGDGLEGADLITYLNNNYQVTSSLGYGPARDVMYGEIDNVDHTLTCVYTSYTIPLNPSQGDPSQMAYELDINCEHTWPQGMFNENEPMRSDMHHLFATWVDANSARSNYVFDEIPDEETDSWYYDAVVYQNPPTEDIREEASELRRSTSFEPPASHKGDVARAIYYFWTTYQNRSEVADDNEFFEEMMDVLREWHYLDPVDDAEVNRSIAIESEQGNRNPFVHDSTLVRRAYYPGSSSVEETEGISKTYSIVSAYPNPFNASTNVKISLNEATDLELKVFNLVGQEVMFLSGGIYPAGTSVINLDASSLPTGNYYLRVSSNGDIIGGKNLVLLK